MTKTDVNRTVKTFLFELEKDRIIKIKSAYLFDSVANGENHKKHQYRFIRIDDSPRIDNLTLNTGSCKRHIRQ